MALVCPPSGDLCPPAIDSTRHSCECTCLHCETSGTGLFAQRAALAGDRSALRRLSPTVARGLVPPCPRRCPHPRRRIRNDRR